MKRGKGHTHDQSLVLSKWRHFLRQFLLRRVRVEVRHKHGSIVTTLSNLGVKRSAKAASQTRTITVCHRPPCRASRGSEIQRFPTHARGGASRKSMQGALDTVDDREDVVRAPSARGYEYALILAKALKDDGCQTCGYFWGDSRVR